jgi:hypothetical protein
VATMLTILNIPNLPKRGDDFAARDPRQTAQARTSTTSSSIGGGIGSS